MTFANIQYSWLFIFVFIYIGLAIYAYYKKKKKLSNFINTSLINNDIVNSKIFNLKNNIYPTNQNLKMSFYLKKKAYILEIAMITITISSFILAIMKPEWGYESYKLKNNGADIIFAIDVSKSMLAEDILPNRLEKTKLLIGDFVRRLINSDRIGLIVFARSAFTLCPLTVDKQTFYFFLDEINTDMFEKQGTQIAKTIQLVRQKFQPVPRGSGKLLILWTDGEDHGEGLEEEIKLCRDEGIFVSIVGIGTKKGDTIPIRDNQGSITNYLKDSSGKVVVSKLYDQKLKKIANQTQSIYLDNPTSYASLESIVGKLNQLAQYNETEATKKQKNNYAHYFIILGVISLIIATSVENEIFFSLMRKNKKPQDSYI